MMFRFEFDLSRNLYWILDPNGFVVDHCKNVFDAQETVMKLNGEWK